VNSIWLTSIFCMFVISQVCCQYFAGYQKSYSFTVLYHSIADVDDMSVF